MKAIMLAFVFAFGLIAACGGSRSPVADTNLTVDQIVGVWKIESASILKDTCNFPSDDEEEEEGEEEDTYIYLEKVDEFHVKVYDCDTDDTCANKDYTGTYDYSKGKITIPAQQEEMFDDGGCRVYLDMPATDAIFSGATSASVTFSYTLKFEGTCDAIKAYPANDPNDPSKTFGDYEDCQIRVKQTLSKQQ